MKIMQNHRIQSVEVVGGRVLSGAGLLIMAPALLPSVRPLTKRAVKVVLQLSDATRRLWAKRRSPLVVVKHDASPESFEIPIVVEAIEKDEAAPAIQEAAAVQWAHLLDVPEFTDDIARQAWGMGLHTLEDVRRAAQDDALRELKGIGKIRQAHILAWFEAAEAG